MRSALLLIPLCFIALISGGQTPILVDYEPVFSPETEYYRQKLASEVQKRLDKIDWGNVERTTGGTAIYTIPVVVHVLHQYGQELITDSMIHSLLNEVNSYFLKTRPDTSNIIDKYKAVAANTQIAFKLATLDPNGNPTKGIEHIFTYLTTVNYFYPEQSKLHQWPQEKYLNIWIVNRFYEPGGLSGTAGNYYIPIQAAYRPYYDGITGEYRLGALGIIRLIASYLNLSYPCSPFSCSDYDGIADTPPCKSIHYTCSNVYDTVCDTPNTQNLMSNSDSCALMFTYGQAQYMQYILQIDIGYRDSLVTPHNFLTTGMGQPMPDMLPVPDYSIAVNSVAPVPQRFFMQGQGVNFVNKSWNDTVIGASWTFSNNAHWPTSTSLTNISNKFHKPGWVSVSLAVTGNNTGTATRTDPQAIYIADSIPTGVRGYLQEFSIRRGFDQWPAFNYYNNEFKWEITNTGCYDNESLKYTGYDTRPFPQNMAGTPRGDIDDIFTPAFDLTDDNGPYFLNFMSSGATRTVDPRYMNDSLEISFSTSRFSPSWTKLTVLKGDQLYNKGTVTTPYVPTSVSDWIPHTLSLPAVANTTYTIFRFRYYPGADSAGMSTGNNFYLDHFNFNIFPEQVSVVDHMDEGISLLPNPTQGNSTIIIKENTGLASVSIEVLDITGRTVYKETHNCNKATLETSIPASVLTSKGLYLVHVVTNKAHYVKKLIVY